MAWLGPILTDCKNLDTFLADCDARGYKGAKVIGGWGAPGGWTTKAKKHLIDRFGDRLILRTTCGDPSNPDTYWYLEPQSVWLEARPWLELKPNLIVELGNEPDVVWDAPKSLHGDMDIWIYRYWLLETYRLFRSECPDARLVFPAMRVNEHQRRWLEIMYDVAPGFDFVAAHIYAWHQLALDHTDTEHYITTKTLYDKYFPGKPVLVTELGIDDKATISTVKLSRYTRFASKLPKHWQGATFFHYSISRASYPQYAVLP